MICKPCARAADLLAARKAGTIWGVDYCADIARIGHSECPGATHCDCQHKVSLQAEGKSTQVGSTR